MKKFLSDLPDNVIRISLSAFIVLLVIKTGFWVFGGR